MAKRSPEFIYAILAYSPSLNITKRIFDEDSLLAPHQHTTRKALADQKATAFAQQLNDQRHKGATDWQAQAKKQPYKTRGQTRANEIKSPTQLQRGY